jgi:hypothetical protein
MTEKKVLEHQLRDHGHLAEVEKPGISPALDFWKKI